MSIIYIVTLFAIGFFIVWEIKTKKARIKKIETIKENSIKEIESSPIKKTKKVETQTTIQKKVKSKKIK
jgi:hypothetical protein